MNCLNFNETGIVIYETYLEISRYIWDFQRYEPEYWEPDTIASVVRYYRRTKYILCPECGRVYQVVMEDHIAEHPEVAESENIRDEVKEVWQVCSGSRHISNVVKNITSEQVSKEYWIKLDFAYINERIIIFTDIDQKIRERRAKYVDGPIIGENLPF